MLELTNTKRLKTQILCSICGKFFFANLSNKAGYTAISCGRVGRGGNTRFPTFQLERDGPTNQPTNRPTNQRTDGQGLL